MMGDMTGNRCGDPVVSGRGRCFLATRHQIVKYILTSYRKREGADYRVRYPFVPYLR